MASHRQIKSAYNYFKARPTISYMLTISSQNRYTSICTTKKTSSKKAIKAIKANKIEKLLCVQNIQYQIMN
jgi:hypothetical protein